MGTEVQSKNCFSVYYSMRDLNEDSNSSSWPLFYGDKSLTNGQYYNGFVPRTVTESSSYSGYDRDALKQKMLEHEAIFRNQVHELHRVYRIQRAMMEEIKKKEFQKQRSLIETSSSSNYLSSQLPFEKRVMMPTFPLTNSGHARTSMSGPEMVNSPSQNGFVSKDCEILEFRPSKVRKKLFDLTLPADEYIDSEEGEQFKESKRSPRDNVKLFLGGNEKRNGLADLNEPVRIEEAIPKPKSEVFNLCNEASLPKSQFRSNNGDLSSLSVENKGKGTEWLSYMYDSGPSRSNLKCVPQPENLPRTFLPTQVMLSKPVQPLAVFPINHVRDNPWMEKMGRNLEIPDRNLESVEASHTPSSFQFLNSSDSAKPWSQKPSSVHSHPSLNLSAALSRTHEISWQKWNVNGGCKPNVSPRNGFYQGSSSSGYKEQPVARFSSVGFDYQNNCNWSGFNRTSENCFKGSSNFVDLESPKADLENDVEIIAEKRKCEEEEKVEDDHPSVLPWLKPKPASSNQCKTELIRDLNQVFESDIDEPLSKTKILGFPIFEQPRVSNNDGETRRRIGLIDINLAAVESVVEEKETDVEVNCFRNQIDLNSCMADDEIPVETPPVSISKIVFDIDLEAPAIPEPEDEDVVDIQPEEEGSKQSDESNSRSESPPERKTEESNEETVRIAAEAIVSISSSAAHENENPPEASQSNCLLWFVDVISSHRDDLETKVAKTRNGADFVKGCCSSDEMDDFEAMTLRMPDTKEEDYMPKPFVPEQNGTTPLPNQTRRGPARRGRQRRDFQKDILPGLASLSRHEVTEDLQTFGGLMRATGHAWNWGLTRRNGGGRGRRRLVVDTSPPPLPLPPVVAPPLTQQLGGVEMGLEERRSLTGWGKTTRRPRRQRCPGGNPSPPVPLT